MPWVNDSPPAQNTAHLSQGEWLTHAIGQRIVRDLNDGLATEPLTEKELQTAFGVSRTIIREAVKSLGAKGLIESRQRVGIIVRPHSEWNLFDPDVLGWCLSSQPGRLVVEHLIEVRRLIEPGATEIAARRRTSQDLDVIEEASARMRTSVHRLADFNDADLVFHNAIFASTHNDYFISLGRAISGALLRTFKISAVSSERALQAAIKHERVADAIRRRDAGGARDAMLLIIDQAAADLIAGLSST